MHFCLARRVHTYPGGFSTASGLTYLTC